MQKLILRLIMISVALTYCISTTSSAQSFFEFGSKKQPAAPTFTPTPVMSSDDFKSAVTKMGQDTKNTINDQVSQQFLKQPPLPESQAAPASTMMDTTVTAPQPVPSVPLPTPQTQTNMAQPLPTYAPLPAAGPSVTTVQPLGAQPAAPAPTTAQPYTGFGTAPANTGTTTTPPPSGNTGGWNIKY